MSLWIINPMDALLHALTTSRDTPISTLEIPLYRREFRTRSNGNRAILEVDKLGFRRYKRHHPFPRKTPPAVDIEGIKTALNHSLHPSLKVVEITDMGNYIIIKLEELP